MSIHSTSGVHPKTPAYSDGNPGPAMVQLKAKKKPSFTIQVNSSLKLCGETISDLKSMFLTGLTPVLVNLSFDGSSI